MNARTDPSDPVAVRTVAHERYPTRAAVRFGLSRPAPIATGARPQPRKWTGALSPAQRRPADLPDHAALSRGRAGSIAPDTDTGREAARFAETRRARSPIEQEAARVPGNHCPATSDQPPSIKARPSSRNAARDASTA